jgi:2'-5' RNA ligase
VEVSTQDVFEFCRERLARSPKPERLFFALMPDEASADRLARFAEAFLRDQELIATAIKPNRLHIALHQLGARKRSSGSLLYGAKLAGQAVAAAGLTLSFDAVGRVGRGLLGLTSTDPALTQVHESLGALLAKNGLRAMAPRPPHIVVAQSTANLPLTVMTPLTLSVTGLALLRGEGTAYRSNFQVLRRWPLNRPPRQL